MDDKTDTALPAGLAEVRLADRFDLSKTSVLLTGAQAVARLLIAQKERDRRAGFNTGGFISGYRGSPVGGLDLQFARLKDLFKANDIHFEPGLNEELAATAIWGAQQAEMRGEGRFDGVFGLWYGKGPGVDRSGDVFRHANLAGTSPRGGVLALMGDDHTAESSTTAHQSEFAFVDVMTPMLSPAGVQEILDYGALGWALSRYAGLWVGVKCIKDTIESTAVVDALARSRPARHADGPRAAAGRPQHPNPRRRPRTGGAPAGAQARRGRRLARRQQDQSDHHLRAAPIAKIGIITAGKSYLDVRQALDDLGIDEARCNALGLRIFKVGCVWPLVPQRAARIRAGARAHHRRRGKALADRSAGARGTLRLAESAGLHRQARRGRPVAVSGEGRARSQQHRHRDRRTAAEVPFRRSARRKRVAQLRRAQTALAEIKQEAVRSPYFCSGCPHNRSTVIPEGARAYAGIGCHFMAQFMDRGTDGYTQMGGEGANWVGEAHFSTRDHVFQNLGDGTYNHSGALALRWAIDSKVNVTYKILFNDAVAMTGGQRHEGGLTVPQIARQVAADGAKRVVVVADDPRKYPRGHAMARGRHAAPARRADRGREGAAGEFPAAPC